MRVKRIRSDVDVGALARSEPVFELYGKTGAGEGIRTLDPNLGKVVLYP